MGASDCTDLTLDEVARIEALYAANYGLARPAEAVAS